MQTPGRRQTEIVAQGISPDSDAPFFATRAEYPAQHWRLVKDLRSELHSSCLQTSSFGTLACPSVSRREQLRRRKCQCGGRRLVHELALPTYSPQYPSPFLVQWRLLQQRARSVGARVWVV